MSNLKFTFAIGDKNKNGKVDVSATLTVFGFVVVDVVKDVSLATAWDLFGAAKGAASSLANKIK